ncbi:MAG: PD-(D/E)XK nuclease family protein [Kiritimatiellae bacterium]|nr:PD-(D/E)XK nuclease family protein [Kiritimatiellia bacterium]
MKKNIIHLNPERKLTDEVVDWLCGGGGRDSKIRKTVEGTLSLAHVLVIVPTAQSARNLRLLLAMRAAEEGAGAIVPPKISMANMLLAPSDRRVASEAEELSAMAEVLLDCDLSEYKALFPRLPCGQTAEWALDMAGMLLAVKSVLGEAGLMMSDVKCEIDGQRWKELGQIEKQFVEKLQANGVMPRCLARRSAAAAGCSESGIEEIVLPSSLDVPNIFVDYLKNSSQEISVLIHADGSDLEKFDEWGRPAGHFSANVDPSNVESFPNAVIEADEAARYFRSVKNEEALPALVVCDPEMHPEIEGAFQNYFSADELALRNPSAELVSKSALGRLLGGIVSIESSGDYDTFSSLLRSGDVARWARDALGVSAPEIARFTGALDSVQNIHLPRTLDEVIAGASVESEKAWKESDRTAAAGLKLFAQAIKNRIKNPIGFLQEIFSSVTLDENNPGDRELIAAAKAIRELRETCASNLISERFRKKIFSRLLNQASYKLEPTAENVLVTTGWLELPWCIEDEIVITGFNEGCVPENIVGHPFIPDALRIQLGISSNASREFRDSFIFSQAVRCRKNGAVSIYMHQISSDKNVMKPSRILFDGISDKDLPDLAKRLYAATKGNSGAPAKTLPSAWLLNLPVPPKGVVFRERMSTTALDQYLRCPFNFYLSELFGEHSDDRAQELDAMEFGSLCHSALEAFAKNGPKESEDPSEIEEFLSGEIDRLLLSFGAELPAIIELQGEAAKERMRAFSVRQAKRRAEGWRIVCSERSFNCRIKQCPTVLSGKIDRIDRHEATGDLAVIDYKTWSKLDNEKCKESLQLPIYRAMLEASGDFNPEKARTSKAFYYILAERAEDSMFYEDAAWHEGLQSDAEDRAVEALTNIAKGIFYPPKNISDAYLPLIWQSVEEGVAPGWIADQIARRGERK